MICNNCGFNNPDEANFCEDCGNDLRAQRAEEAAKENVETAGDTAAGMASEAVDEVKESAASTIDVAKAAAETDSVEDDFSDIEDTEIKEPINPYSEEEPKKKKSKAPIIIVVVVALLALIGAGVAFGQNLFKTPEEKLIEAMENTNQAKQKIITGEYGISDFKLEGVGVMEAAMAENLIKGFKVEYQIMSDIESYEVAGFFNIVMSESDLLRLDYFLNKEYIAIGMPQLYDNIVYVQWKDVKDILIKYEVATEEELENFNIDPDRTIELIDAYVEALNVEEYDSISEIDSTKFMELAYGFYTNSILEVVDEPYSVNVVGEQKDFDGSVYYLDMDYAAMYDDMMEFYKELIADDALLPIIKEGIDRVFATIVEQEDDFMYNLVMAMAEEEPVWGWEDSNAATLDQLKADAYEALDEEYDEMIEEVLSEMEGEEFEEMNAFMKEIYSEIDIETTLVVENKQLVAQEMEFTIDDSILDAINDYEASLSEYSEESSDLMGGDLGMAPSMSDLGMDDLLFELSYYMTNVYDNIGQPVAFEDLPGDAVDMATISDEDLMMMGQEIMMNAQTLFGAFGAGF